jgi:arylsulfatase A-like enzyme
MKTIITTSIALITAGSGMPGCTPGTKEPDRPNIIFILADDMGWGDLNLNPGQLVREHGPEAVVNTPHLDQLAASGVRFTNGYANHMVCAPSRAGMLTGRYQHFIGYFGFDETMAAFPAEVPMLPEPLRNAGYATGMMGKWHISYSRGSKPLDRGFERFYGFLGGEHDYFEPHIGQAMHGIGYSTDAFVYDQHEPVQEMGYLTDELTKRSKEFIESARSTNRPFFLYLAHHAPHTPLQVPWEDLEPFARARGGEYTSRDIARAMIQRLDKNIGALVAYLQEQGLYENTMIIFSSDNGASQPCYAGGLRGRKGYFYEGGIRVPMIVSWPKKIPAGQILHEPVITHDVFPTVLETVGITEMPEGIEGVSWLSYMIGKEKQLPRKQLFWGQQNINGKWAVREGDWKLISEDTNDWFGAWPILERRQEAPPPDFRVQLFNLATDPFEQHDISDQHPEIVARLTQSVQDFYARHAPTLATDEVKNRTEAMKQEREQNPDRYPTTHRIDGAPGHWRGRPR